MGFVNLVAVQSHFLLQISVDSQMDMFVISNMNFDKKVHSSNNLKISKLFKIVKNLSKHIVLASY